MTTRYDCTMFFNENDLYEIRLNQHWNFIDKFIVVEAGETFTGLKKPFNFDHERFAKYADKIVYRKFDTFEEAMRDNPDLVDDYCLNDKAGGVDSMRDHFQYNYMYKVLKEVGAEDRDPVYFSCCDEIIKFESFEACRQMLEESPIVEGQRRPLFMFHYWLYVYKFNLLCQHWSQHVSGGMTEVGNFKNILPATIRGKYITDFNVPDAGWEFTFLDPTEGEYALAKHKSWGHSKDVYEGKKTKFEFTEPSESVERLFDDYKPTVVPIIPETHPQYIIDNLDKLKNFIYNEDIK